MPPQSAPVDVEQPLLEVWARFFSVNAERVLYKDEQVVAFWDRSPAAAIHLLIVPRHIPLMGVESLSAEHAPLLAHMGAVGRRLAGGATPQVGRPAPVDTDEVILGFHRWPLRSVPHLHLHALRRPFTPGWQSARYTEWSCACGAGFIDLATVVERLSSG